MSSNSTIDEYIRRQTKYQDQVNQLCKPLQEHFGIEYIDHLHVTTDHRIYGLSNNPQIPHSYLEYEIPKYDPFINRADSSSIPKICMPLATIKEYGNKDELKLVEWASGLNVGQPILFKQDTEDGGYDISVFFNQSNNPNAINTYLNNVSTILDFIQYFRRETYPLMQKLDEYGIPLPEIVGKDYYNAPNIFISNKEIIRTCSLGEMFELGSSNPIQLLSQREKQCVLLYIQNKTAREISAKLNISYRTVEKHIDNAKAKLGCRTKLALYKKFTGLNEFIHIQQV
ncbi:helix-turn-helix transcriptional regulator [Candidiatus Paracoxiella cheracis]|uniref:helix-turn-helix transcriptional regulator n=1 Tax=Candidiatus Paracoxiella cheracis TaxID=3405120 RepID=UPI003BF46F04